jgi:hypothetical protein
VVVRVDPEFDIVGPRVVTHPENESQASMRRGIAIERDTLVCHAMSEDPESITSYRWLALFRGHVLSEQVTPDPEFEVELEGLGLEVRSGEVEIALQVQGNGGVWSERKSVTKAVNAQISWGRVARVVGRDLRELAVSFLASAVVGYFTGGVGAIGLRMVVASLSAPVITRGLTDEGVPVWLAEVIVISANRGGDLIELGTPAGKLDAMWREARRRAGGDWMDNPEAFLDALESMSRDVDRWMGNHMFKEGVKDAIANRIAQIESHLDESR